ncbi:CRISPR-associated endonuclease Cas3'' [Halomarina halobia]|uniref:CRISPR-associated endonuclease Cas3 n=1 Tax=Halomarina halobia TaxID=3033386 RepID=A0ABD6A6V9_9EURY|nr:CRISPR-associated endonuclease Cas3'' [Halomarina sp. PSR21]
MVDFTRRPSHVTRAGERVPLDRHLGDVAERVGWLVPADAETPNGDSLCELAVTVAEIHDFGKLTSWFHDHLTDGAEAVSEGPTHHAPLGALVAHRVLVEKGFEGTDPLLGFLAVARHHGRLPDATSYVYRACVDSGDRLPRLYREDPPDQIDDIDGSVPNLAVELLDRTGASDTMWETVRSEIPDVRRTREYRSVAEPVCTGSRRLREAPGKLPEGFYAALVQVWSALVLADKTSTKHLVSGVPVDREAYSVTQPRRVAVDAYVRNLQAENASDDLTEETVAMNERREEARQSIRRRAEAFEASDRDVATLTLPTGMGKTLSGLDAALTVLDGESNGRLIYALPYTSIVDQLAEVSRTVFDAAEGDDLLTVDHHLAETLVKLATDSETVPDDAVEDLATLLGESWRSGMVVTTFVQLFESLAGPTNARAMKLPALYDSVVVLDEPQALPLKWWPLVNRLMEVLTQQYGASVIAMTATQPRLLSDDGREPFELVEDSGRYFDALDRLEFDLHPTVESYLGGAEEPETLGYAEAADTLAGRLKEGTSVLSICNTIDSARELAEAVETAVDPVVVNEVYQSRLGELSYDPDTPVIRQTGWSRTLDPRETVEEVLSATPDNGAALLHLTTRHRPCDRAHLIEVATELLDRDVPLAFVSTQLVEAGVDVSFEEVFRDYAPMDSIVQAAGRCNRSFDRDRGRVTVWFLDPPENRTVPPASSIYGLHGESLTKVTARALSSVYDGTPIPERTVTTDAVERYFEELDARGVGSEGLAEHVDVAEAEKLGRLSLIEERSAVDVVVARTDGEERLFEEIRKARTEHRWDDVDDLVDATRELQVSVPVYRDDRDANEKIRGLHPLVPGGERRWLDGRPGHDGGYFDAMEGFVVPDTTAEARLL